MSNTTFLQSFSLSAAQVNNHSRISGTIVWTTGALLLMVLPVTLARFYVRLTAKPGGGRAGRFGTLGWDDALLLAASLSQIVFAIFAIIGAKRGLGKHIWDFPLVSATATSLGQLSLIKLREVIVILFCIYVAYALAITFTKLSLIASYLRVFPDKRFRQLMYVISASVILLCIASTIVIIFQCNPASSAWDWSIRRDQCLNIHTFLYASSAINTCTDFVLWAAPLPLVWKLHMSKKAKVGLAFLFGCGLVGCLAGLFRLGQLHGFSSEDLTYTGVEPLNCSMWEVSLGIVCACVPPLRPLFRKMCCSNPRKSISPPPVVRYTPVDPITPDTRRPFPTPTPGGRLRQSNSAGTHMEELDPTLKNYVGPSMHSNISMTGTFGETGSARSMMHFV